MAVRTRRAVKHLGLPAPESRGEVCLELEDNDTKRVSAVDYFQTRQQRDPVATAGVLAEQFTAQNRSLLARMEVSVDTEYDGRDVKLRLSSGNQVGAIPLVAPLTARPDFGLVVQPRFPWAGIGPMLATMGWRVCPQPLRLPLLRRSERRVPPWVLSSMVLTRMKALLDSLERRFELVEEVRSAPRGRVNWPQYATVSLPKAALLAVPCTYPDLRDDRLLRGAVRHVVETQLRSLETQRQHGSHVHRLLELAGQLLERVRNVTSWRPSANVLEAWQRRPLRSTYFAEGLQAIEWTVEDRGLAGLSDLDGIPWVLPMDGFFEAWVESIFVLVARRNGMVLRCGRTGQTTHPLRWRPGHIGAQRSLVPDVVLENGELTLVVDAKYKRHWEELRREGAATGTRESHRHDVLQALAYANLSRTARTVACLVYPCRPAEWEAMRSAGRLVQRAEVTSASRAVEIWLTAVPMNGDPQAAAEPLSQLLRET